MAFNLPTFNLTANVWRQPNEPPAAPDFTLACQLYLNPRPQGQDGGGMAVYVRVPKGSDLRSTDIVDPDGLGVWYYQVQEVEPAHLGFANEYLAGWAYQWIPPVPPGSNAILLEDGFYLLLEDGSKILLE